MGPGGMGPGGMGPGGLVPGGMVPGGIVPGGMGMNLPPNFAPQMMNMQNPIQQANNPSDFKQKRA
jgi:membrane protease subunit (stomatin/prohibitin family)